jgi:hypothetical protein
VFARRHENRAEEGQRIAPGLDRSGGLAGERPLARQQSVDATAAMACLKRFSPLSVTLGPRLAQLDRCEEGGERWRQPGAALDLAVEQREGGLWFEPCEGHHFGTKL